MQNKSSFTSRLDVKAFTLIELLVVVLIIGILAAVALPQYQKAVEKSRATQALAVLKSVGDALQVHYVANGSYPGSFDELATSIDSWTGEEKWAENYGVLDTRSNGDWSLQLYRNSSGGLNLYVGRLTGQYKGGGFVRYMVGSSGNIQGNKVYCAEKVNQGVVFEGNEGNYCRQIFQAVGPTENRSFRSYVMP